MSDFQITDPLIGRTIEGYRFLRLLGRGAFGAVYQAQHPRIPGEVAVKYIRVDDTDQLEAIQTEIDILARLNHPGVVRIFDAFSFENYQLIMMELIKGGTLRDVMKALSPGDRPELLTVLEGMKQVTAALNYVHSQKVLHLDLKPANIMLNVLSETESPRFVLTDFGISQFTQTVGGQATAAGGTPLYMSPEHFGFGDNRPDRRSDIYSTGVILYELLVGRVPFKAAQIGELLQMHNSQSPPPPPDNLKLSPDLIQIMMKALEKQPEDRYQTAGEMHQALESVQHHIQMRQRKPDMMSSFTRFAQEKEQQFDEEAAAMPPPPKRDETGETMVGFFRLRVMHPDGSDEVYIAASPEIVIGRSSKADLTLKYQSISRQHARVRIDDLKNITIVDLGSVNKTYLNSSELTPHQPHVWHPNSYITIQGVTLMLESIGAERPSGPPVTMDIGTGEIKNLLDEVEQKQQQPRVLIDVTPEIVYVEAGKPQYVGVDVFTQNTPAAQYEVQVSGTDIDSRWYTLPAGRIIQPNDGTRFELTLIAPETGAIGGRTHEVVVEVVPDNPDIPTAFHVLKVVVVRHMRFNITLKPKEISHGRGKRKASLSIHNQGNYDETFNIYTEAPDLLMLETPDAQVLVPSGETTPIPLRLRARRGAQRSGRLLFTLNVVSQNGMSERINGSYVFRSGIRRFSLSSLIFMLMLLGLLALAVYRLSDGGDLNTLIRSIETAVRSVIGQ